MMYNAECCFIFIQLFSFSFYFISLYLSSFLFILIFLIVLFIPFLWPSFLWSGMSQPGVRQQFCYFLWSERFASKQKQLFSHNFMMFIKKTLYYYCKFSKLITQFSKVELLYLVLKPLETYTQDLSKLAWMNVHTFTLQ